MFASQRPGRLPISFVRWARLILTVLEPLPASLGEGAEAGAGAEFTKLCSHYDSYVGALAVHFKLAQTHPCKQDLCRKRAKDSNQTAAKSSII